MCFLFRIRVYGRLWPPRPPFFIRFLGPRGFKYVSSFSGCICHEYLNFIQSGCGHCMVRFLGILRRGGGGGMLSQLIDFVNDCFIPRISTGRFIFPYTKLNVIFTNLKIARSWILLDPFSTNFWRNLTSKLFYFLLKMSFFLIKHDIQIFKDHLSFSNP